MKPIGPLFAFWENVNLHGRSALGAPITAARDDGWFRVAGYDGLKVRPVAIFPVERGRKLLGEIETSRRERDKEIDAAKIKHATVVDRLLGIRSGVIGNAEAPSKKPRKGT